MQVNEYRLIQKCVEDGTKYGLARALQHDETPADEDIVDQIVCAVMLELCEWFNFEDTK